MKKFMTKIKNPNKKIQDDAQVLARKNPQNSCNKKIAAQKMNSTTDTASAPNGDVSIIYHKNNKGDNDNNNAKAHLGITALIAIMELLTESQAFRAHKQPLKGYPSNKTKLLLDSGSDVDLFFLQNGKDKPFVYLTTQVPMS